MTDTEIKALIQQIRANVFTNEDNVYYILSEALEQAEGRGFDDGYASAEADFLD